ncbi:hypothetical protein EDB92DRAFT_1818613 [Lactarius akahatsu]|uniref:Uncharacterized protein n=1 Tax=Lactarius akahatsu TaxID=416441 RepID=A0AAD4L9J2_9AGAM|nr:hypothetical protein EDB92DRAFT_1818613 [Lactarius akahatsu]
MTPVLIDQSSEHVAYWCTNQLGLSSSASASRDIALTNNPDRGAPPVTLRVLGPARRSIVWLLYDLPRWGLEGSAWEEIVVENDSPSRPKRGQAVTTRSFRTPRARGRVAIRRDDRDHGSHRETQGCDNVRVSWEGGAEPEAIECRLHAMPDKTASSAPHVLDRNAAGPPTRDYTMTICSGIGPEADKALSALEVLWSLFVHYGGHPDVAVLQGRTYQLGASDLGSRNRFGKYKSPSLAVGHENLTSRLQQTIDPWLASWLRPADRLGIRYDRPHWRGRRIMTQGLKRRPGTTHTAGVACSFCYSDPDEKISEEAGKDEMDAVIDERSAPRHAAKHSVLRIHCTDLPSSGRGNCVAPDGVWLLLFRSFKSRACA